MSLNKIPSFLTYLNDETNSLHQETVKLNKQYAVERCTVSRLFYPLYMLRLRVGLLTKSQFRQFRHFFFSFLKLNYLHKKPVGIFF